jgi:hypothetical protein
MIGIDGLYFSADGSFGAGLSAGIGFGNYMITFGVDYKIPTSFVFDINKITYSAGLQYRF